MTLIPAHLVLAALLGMAGAAVHGPGRQAPGLERQRLAKAVEHIYRGDPDRAIRELNDLSAESPEDPAPDFDKAVALTWKSYIDSRLDGGRRDFDDEILALLDSAATKAEALKNRADVSRPDEIRALYYLGSAAAMRARLEMQQNRMIPAARAGKQAQELFARLREMDPENRDALFAPAGVYYHAGVFMDSAVARMATSVLGAGALPEGDRERGLADLEKASRESLMTRDDARFSLMEIHTFKEKQYDRALELAGDLLSDYPHNQIFHRFLLRIHWERQDRKAVESAARAIIDLASRDTPGFGPFIKAEAERFLAQARRPTR